MPGSAGVRGEQVWFARLQPGPERQRRPGWPASRRDRGPATGPGPVPGPAAARAARDVPARRVRARGRPPAHRRPRPPRRACSLGNGDREGGQELRGSASGRGGRVREAGPGHRVAGLRRRVVRVRGERRDLVGPPDAQRHRGQDRLKLAAVAGREQAKRAPLAWFQRRTPQAQQVPLGGQVTRMARPRGRGRRRPPPREFLLGRGWSS